MDRRFFIARDKDNRLFKFSCWDRMFVTEVPHRHVNGYPFDGNYYSKNNEYQPTKGEEIDMNLFPYITYANSPVLFIHSDKEESVVQKCRRIVPDFWEDFDLTPMGEFYEYEMISLAKQ